jgi:hypothetical protein
MRRAALATRITALQPDASQRDRAGGRLAGGAERCLRRRRSIGWMVKELRHGGKVLRAHTLARPLRHNA